MKFLIGLMAATAPVVLCLPSGHEHHSHFMPREANGDSKLIDWGQDDVEFEKVVKEVDYAYIARDPVDIPKINKLADELYTLAEAKSELVAAFKVHAGDAYFGHLWSRVGVDATVKPFTDGSVFNLDFEYKKGLSMLGLQNEGTITGSYKGNTYKKLRYVFMKFILPQLVAGMRDDELPKHTIRSFFEELCPATRKKFQDILDEISAKKEPHDSELRELGDALLGAAFCDVLEAVRTEKDFSSALTFMAPHLKHYKRAFAVLDPRPWVAKLVSGYDVKIVDCQDVVSRWTPFYHCEPYVSLYVKLGATGLASSWAHVAMTEGGIDVSAIAYAPTYGTGFLTGHDLDIVAYAMLKTLGARLTQDKFRGEVLEALDDFLARDPPAGYEEFLEFQKEFDSFDWEHEDFGWDEDEDQKEKEKERRHRHDDPVDDDDDDDDVAPEKTSEAAEAVEEERPHHGPHGARGYRADAPHRIEM